MKKKVDEINELEKYLKKPSKKLLEKIDSVELTDFPKLSVEFIRKKITFDWYKNTQVYLTWQNILTKTETLRYELKKAYVIKRISKLFHLTSRHVIPVLKLLH